MKKIKLGSVEVLGYIGILIWAAVIFLRKYYLSDNGAYLLLIGILPNLAAAWVFVMYGKWIVLFLWKRSLTMKIHLFICVGILILAFGSEIAHEMFLDSPFDIYDMLITIIALIIIFLTPLLTKDRYFSDYGQ